MFTFSKHFKAKTTEKYRKSAKLNVNSIFASSCFTCTVV